MCTALSAFDPLVTTPESLYVLLTSEGGRRVLTTLRSVIVDEIHALTGNKRGTHLSLSLERLEHLCQRPLFRIGLRSGQHCIAPGVQFLHAGGLQFLRHGNRQRAEAFFQQPSQ